MATSSALSVSQSLLTRTTLPHTTSHLPERLNLSSVTLRSSSNRLRSSLRLRLRLRLRSSNIIKATAVDTIEKSDTSLVDKSVNTIRFLAIDAVEKANSGHPGLPMGCAPMGHILYDEIMRYNPKNPYWFNRDRFVLSAGHGCMLQYALLHLAGYESVQVNFCC